MEIPLYHFAPFFLLLLADFRISVSRQIDKVQRVINIIKINRLCLARLRTGARQ